MSLRTLNFCLPFVLAFSCNLPCFAETSTNRFTWPNGAKAAVSLAYDDALNSQLDNAIPALNRHGLKASFYLQLSSLVVEARLPEWRAAAAHGHELGNHTLFHQCSASKPGREWVLPYRDLDKTSAAQMKAEVQLANSMLFAIDGKRERTFTVPCTDSLAKGENYVDSVRSAFVAIKLAEGGVVPDMQQLDPYNVGVYVPINVSGQQLIDIVAAAARQGTMVNITFHGIGGDYLAVSREAHESLLRHLAAHRDIYWTSTFIELMQYVKAHQARR